jgi:hemoglobin
MAQQTSSEATSAQQSLYDRLGGVYAIAAVIDDFINRIMDNPRLNANPKVDEAHHRVSRAGFKYLVTEMVCWATGGPQQYTGRSMRDSHVHLAITEEEWQVFMEDLQACLDHFAVPQTEQGEIIALVESTKGDIVLPTRSL